MYWLIEKTDITHIFLVEYESENRISRLNKILTLWNPSFFSDPCLNFIFYSSNYKATIRFKHSLHWLVYLMKFICLKLLYFFRLLPWSALCVPIPYLHHYSFHHRFWLCSFPYIVLRF